MERFMSAVKRGFHIYVDILALWIFIGAILGTGAFFIGFIGGLLGTY